MKQKFWGFQRPVTQIQNIVTPVDATEADARRLLREDAWIVPDWDYIGKSVLDDVSDIEVPDEEFSDGLDH